MCSLLPGNHTELQKKSVRVFSYKNNLMLSCLDSLDYQASGSMAERRSHEGQAILMEILMLMTTTSKRLSLGSKLSR